jgi:hypothetical protein
MAKFTAAKIKEQIKKIQQAIDKEKSRYRDQNLKVTEVKPEDIERKLRHMKSPMIVLQAWISSAPAGGTITYIVGFWNPDPFTAHSIFVHVWVGSGNVDPVVGTFLLNVDTRFPRLTEPADGVSIDPSSFWTISFALKVPAGVQKTNYLGNTCLMQFNWHDVGVYLDRGVWPFTVT